MFAAQSNRTIPGAVATSGMSERVVFLRKTYAHLGGAVLAFVGLCYLLLDGEIVSSRGELVAVDASPLFEAVTLPWMKLVMTSWFIVIALFMGVGWLANKWAYSDTSRGLQYLGLAVYVVAEAFVFLPLLYMATNFYDGAITTAGILTSFIFAGLTATVFITKKDFSFMRGALTIAGFGALGLIVASMLIGFQLGMLFMGFMILLAGGYVLYYTSNVLHHYRPTQYVAASLALFSAVALLFYYILMFVMEMSRD